MSQRRRPPASAMRYRRSKAISFMKPRVPRLAVLASRTLSWARARRTNGRRANRASSSCNARSRGEPTSSGRAFRLLLRIRGPVRREDRGGACVAAASPAESVSSGRAAQAEGAVKTMLVVMPHVDTQHALEMAAANDQDPVEATRPDRSDPAFGVGVRVGCPNRRADHLDPLGTEDLVEAAAELRVAIVDQKPERLRSPSCISRLRACCAVQPPSGFGVQATYSIRRVASEMKNST